MNTGISIKCGIHIVGILFFVFWKQVLEIRLSLIGHMLILQIDSKGLQTMMNS